MEDTTEKVMASEKSTEETSKTEVVIVETSTAKPSNTTQNMTDASLKNVTASTNATNTTEVEEYDGPSAILYPRKFVFGSCRTSIDNSRMIDQITMQAMWTEFFITARKSSLKFVNLKV